MLELPIVKFKTKRIELEWKSGSVNIKLVYIIELALRYIRLEHRKYKFVMLTDIFRYHYEQDEIYLNHKNLKIRKKYRRRPWPSVHENWRGIDMRTRGMPRGLPKKLERFLNLITYDKKRPSKKTAILHDVGTGKHLHIQVWIN